MSDYLIVRRDGSLVADALVLEPGDRLASLMLLGLAAAMEQHAEVIQSGAPEDAMPVSERAAGLRELAAEWGNRSPAPELGKENAAIAHLIAGTHGDLSHLLVKDLKK